MVSLLSLLDLGAAGLHAHHSGAGIAANNAANVNTVGYSRQRLDLQANLLGGVRSGSPQRHASELLAGRERLSRGASGHSSARAPALMDLQASLTAAGPGVDEHLARLWSGLQRVAAMPTDSLMRDAAVAAARALAEAMQERADAVSRARADADARIRDGVDRASTLARQIADANQALGVADDPVLRDRRDTAARELAGLVGGEGRIDGDGRMRWVLPDGGVLVDGDHAASLTASPDPATGLARVELVDGNRRRDVTTALDAGTIGGELSFRDGEAAASAAALDQLAFDVTSAFNATHRGNAGLDGVVGRDLFAPQAGVSGAASRMAVDAGVLADPDQLAVAGPGGAAGDNAGALALLALRDQKLAAGGSKTFGDAAIDLAADVGRAAADAESATVRDGEVAGHLAGLRDSLSGVDLDEELARLVHFQHASEAMTRFLSTVDGMLGDLLSRL